MSTVDQQVDAALIILYEAHQLRMSSAEELRNAVVACRQAGATWQEIADVIGTSRQYAWKTYARWEP